MTGEALSAYLTRNGLDEIEGARKRLLGDLVLQHFARVASGDPSVALWVPGRIEVFGKHTDYAGGHSLVAPVPRGFVFVARKRHDRAVSMTDASRDEQFTIDLADPARRASGLPAQEPAPGGWRRYAATTVHRLHRNFPDAHLGADVVFASDLPPASGMSSSSALMVGLASILVRLAEIEQQRDWQAAIASPADAAGYFACIENGLPFASLAGDAGVGTHGGSEDHVAMICGRPGQLSAWRFVPIRHVADVAVSPDWMFVIGSSGVAARKTGGAKEGYNRLSRLTQTLLEIWNGTERQAPSLHAAVTSSDSAPARLMRLIGSRATGEPPAADLERRLTHFLNEDARIAEAVRAFREGDRERIGALADDSQSDAERLLQTQLAETTALARAARNLGAFGASSFGAGFGGSAWALVQRTDAADFAARWLAEYRTLFPAREAATVFLAPPGPALAWLD